MEKKIDELSLNRKIEKAIRFNDFNKAIQLCTEIARAHALECLNRVDRGMLEHKDYSTKKGFEILCRARAKIVYPLIEENTRE